MRFCISHELHRRRCGFTLIELMVTLVILSVLALISAPLMEVANQRTKEQELRFALRQIREALDKYKQAAEDGRIALSDDESGYPHTLRELVDGVDDIKDPKKGKIYFLRRLPRDPMFDESVSSAENSWGKRSYQSTSDDPKEGQDVFDVYSLSNSVGLNGVPYNEW